MISLIVVVSMWVVGDERDDVHICVFWCRVEHYGGCFAFKMDEGFTKSRLQLVKSRRSNSRTVCFKNSRFRHVESGHSNSVPGDQ